ncbi:hypothetical protein [Flaviaesturariibacter amylovorans]|uniref:DUF4625 domain-containing protein n=1 Tax=Flaviaesturariibacter amylovorans TaxID=1084520 RepID=A0ABP8H621_9BACT
MKRISAFFATTFTAILALSACSKHAGDLEEPHHHATDAVVVFARPTANAVFANGDTVRIEAQAIAPATIHGYELTITKAGDTTTIFQARVHDHNDTLRINQFWVNDRTEAQQLEAKVKLQLDHDGGRLTRSTVFRVL